MPRGRDERDGRVLTGEVKQDGGDDGELPNRDFHFRPLVNDEDDEGGDEDALFHLLQRL